MATKNDIDRQLAFGRSSAWVFCILLFAMMLVPLVGMAWAPTTESTENRQLADAPELVAEDGYPNAGFLSDAGRYFADHYAFRTALVDADARLCSGLFGLSTTDQVICGQDGWLYYGGTLSDFQDRSPLRPRQAANIAHNARMLQDYCQAHGARFALTIAPDKNHLHPQAMPYYYPQVENDDMELLRQSLQDAGVSYVDATEGTELPYYSQDSHWDNQGALIIHDRLMAQLGAEPFDFAALESWWSDTYYGDLAKMLYPLSAQPEEDLLFAGVNDGSGASGAQRSGSLWEFQQGASVEDGSIVTRATAAPKDGAAAGNDSLLMFRDSFGNNLIPYFACDFQEASFSKLIPYNFLLVAQDSPDAVIVERAQRHMGYLAQEAPLMPCPAVDATQLGAVEPGEGLGSSCESAQNGPLVSFAGTVTGLPQDAEGEVLLRITDGQKRQGIYRTFALSDDESGDDWGYCAYLASEAWDDAVNVEVLVNQDGLVRTAGSHSLIIR